MYLAAGSVVLGLALLSYGADRFVIGAASLARNLGVAPIVIGMTVVGLATSAPEILVSTVASLAGSGDVAIGNAVGSNIANIGLVLGTTAVICPLVVRSTVLEREYPLMFVGLVIALVLLADGWLGRVDGVLMLFCLAVAMYMIVRLAMGSRARDPLRVELEHELPKKIKTTLAITWLVVGLVLLLGGSKLLVGGAVEIARYFGVSELVIGLTVVAVGTSLPELAASVASALKDEPEIAVGNVLGSNLFNILGVLCVPGLLAPAALSPGVLGRDFPVMVGLSIAMFVFASGFGKPGRINRVEGLLLLLSFVIYQTWLLAKGG